MKNLLILLPAVLLLAGCSRDPAVAAGGPSSKVEAAPDPNVVEVKSDKVFPLVKVETRALPTELAVNGAVFPDVARTVHVTSQAGGRVVEIRARLGDEVKKGQVLMVIHSADLAAAIADSRKAVADEALSRKALERVQMLYSRGAAPRKDQESAEDAEEKAKVDVQAAAERIRILGGDPEHPSPMIELRAPISGTVIEQNTAGGEGVKSLDNTPNLFTIADLGRVWVLADVYENNLSDVALGDRAEVRLNAYPERSLTAQVSNISRILDPATRTAKVRLELSNPEGLLRPGMFAVVRFISRGKQERMVAPSTAVVRLQDRYWVFRKEGERRFRRIEVRVAEVLPDGFQILLDGVKAGDELAAQALQFSSSGGDGSGQ